MDVSKLPIQIINPTKEAINNFLNSDLFFPYIERYKSYDLNNHELDFFYNLKSDKDLGKLLLYVYKHPTIKLSDLGKVIKGSVDFKKQESLYVTISNISIAIESKLLKKYEIKRFEFLVSITDLGIAVLKQNELI